MTVPLHDLTDVWSDGGTAFAGIKMNVTNTASAAGSKLLDLQIGGSSVAGIDKVGNFVNYGSTTTAPASGVGFGNWVGTLAGFSAGNLIFTANAVTWNFVSDLALMWGGDVGLARDAAGVLAQRNSTNGQSFRLYNTFTNSANFERAVFDWGTTSNVLTIGIQAAGTGSARNVKFITGAQYDFVSQHAAGVEFVLGNSPAQIIATGSLGLKLGTDDASPVQIMKNMFSTPVEIARFESTAASITQTWNAGATAFTGFKLNVTDTASDSGSLLLNLQVGGNTKFSVRKDGMTLFADKDTPGANSGWIQGTGSGLFVNSLGGYNLYLMSAGTWIGKAVKYELRNISEEAVNLATDANDILAQRNSTLPQSFRLYNTYTNSANYERCVIDWTSNAGYCFIGLQQAGTGSVRPLSMGPNIIFQDQAPASILRIWNQGAGVRVAAGISSFIYGWLAAGDVAGSIDTGISRSAAAAVAIGNGTAGDTSGTIQAAGMNIPGHISFGYFSQDQINFQLGSGSITWGSDLGITRPAAGVIAFGNSTAGDTSATIKAKVANIIGGTATTSNPVLDLSQTWNASGVAFTGINLNITNTASAAYSSFLNMKVGGTSAFIVGHDSVPGPAIWLEAGAASPSDQNYILKSNAGGYVYLNCPPAKQVAFSIGNSAVALVASDGSSVGLGALSANALGFWNAGGAVWDAVFRRDAAGIIAQRDSTNPQAWRLYNTFTDSANYERGVLDWTTTSNTLTIGTQNAGTGSARSIAFRVNGIDVLTIAANQGITGSPSSGFAIGNNGLNSLGVYATTLSLSSSFGSDTTITRAAAGVFAFGTGVQEFRIGLGNYNTTFTIAGAEVATFHTGPGLSLSSVGGSPGVLVFQGTASPYPRFYYDAASTIAQRDATNAQTFRLYNTFTDASNYERLGITWSGNAVTLAPAAAGTGTVRNLFIDLRAGTAGTPSLTFGSSTRGFVGSNNAGGIDITYVSSTESFRFMQAEINFVANGLLTWGNQNNTFASSSSDTGICRAAAGVVAFGDGSGGGNASATIKAKTKAGAPTTSDVPAGTWALIRDTSGATTKLYYNNAGTLQSVALV